jgi:hypothetical protein
MSDPADETYKDNTKQVIATAGGGMLGGLLGYRLASRLPVQDFVVVGLAAGIMSSIVHKNWDNLKNTAVAGENNLLPFNIDMKQIMQYGVITGGIYYLMGTNSLQGAMVSGWLGGASAFFV